METAPLDHSFASAQRSSQVEGALLRTVTDYKWDAPIQAVLKKSLCEGLEYLGGHQAGEAQDRGFKDVQAGDLEMDTAGVWVQWITSSLLPQFLPQTLSLLSYCV